MPTLHIPWESQERQVTFLKACGLAHPFVGGQPSKPVADIIFYGGAAGGGKSDALIMAGKTACLSFAKCKVGFFRREYTQLEGPGGAIDRSQELIGPLADVDMVSWHGTNRRWTFHNGSIFEFGHIKRESDKYNYQSQQFDVLLFDESTQFTETQIRYMMSRNRATNPNIIQPFTGMASNPGHISHGWHKEQFIDVGPPEKVHSVDVEGEPETHMFIPSKLSDNPALTERDPGYLKRLKRQPDHVRKQLLEGSWDAVDGMAFPEWDRDIHVYDPKKVELSKHWLRFRSLDWGYAAPYSVGWYAIDFDGRLWKYRERYGWGGRPNHGSRENVPEVAKAIFDAEYPEIQMVQAAVADDSIWGAKQDGSRSIGEQFADEFAKFEAQYGVEIENFQPVGKGPGSRISGKLEVHERLKAPKDGELPMLMVSQDCRHTIRTMPSLPRDENRPEDVDTHAEDHAYDETRYACMYRSLASEQPTKENPPLPHALQTDEPNPIGDIYSWY